MAIDMGAVGGSVAGLFWSWLSIFAAPIKNIQMLWILIPVYISWAFAEFYQEKRGTSLGNAVTNGAIPLLVGFDWSRQVVGQALASRLFDHVFFTKLAIAVLAFGYGAFVIYHGIRLRSRVKVFGRIRIVTYVVVVLTPVYYGAVQPSLSLLLAVLLFFPIYYFLIEVLDFIIPDPKVMEAERQDTIESLQGQQYSQGQPYAYNPHYPGYPYQGYPPYYQQPYNPYSPQSGPYGQVFQPGKQGRR